MDKKSIPNVFSTTIRFHQRNAKKKITLAARMRGMSLNAFTAQMAYDAALVILSAAAPTTAGTIAAENVIAQEISDDTAQPLEN